MSKMLIRAAGLTWVIVVAVATLPEAPIAAAQAAQSQTAAAGAPGSRSVLQQVLRRLPQRSAEER